MATDRAQRTALITGITGQDGQYLAELLLDKGYRVVGAAQDVAKAAAKLAPALRDNVTLTAWNMTDQGRIEALLSTIRPNELYNFAAYSSGEGMFDDPVAIGDVNGLAIVRILEAIRRVDPGIRFCQASSSEMFGEAASSPQSEEMPFCPRSPYGAAKLYAHSMVRVYRLHYRLFACSAILFNHESPRRGLAFVTRKVTHAAAKIKLGLSSELRLGNLDARRDWGFAGDYVRAMWLMLQNAEADDYVIATGETHSVRNLCEQAFGYLGLDYRQYVQVDNASYRPGERVQLVGDPAKARRALGWVPQVTFSDLVKMMVDADLARIGQNRVLSEG